VSEDFFVGTISNIMQTISASQDRQVARESSRTVGRSLLAEDHFRSILCAEKKRSERFSKHMILMQLSSRTPGGNPSSLSEVGAVLSSVIRETDLAGWIKADCSLGVIFTELGDCDDVAHAERVIRKRLSSFLETCIAGKDESLCISFASFCDEWGKKSDRNPLPIPNVVSNVQPVALSKKLSVAKYPELAARSAVNSSTDVF
jgi:hypothetical protein